ncbi:Superoxide dismutase [Mn] 1 [bioreactor metagenome]|uniref:superoxide dismutase n=1 Tax=bioreactor metagenome TaxID=1076179 RepID=A0A645AF48_9ZZZZ
MAPAGTSTISKELEAAILHTFGSYDKFKEKIKQAGLSQFGSGWAFLVADSKNGLRIENLPNQDVPLSDTSWPILPMDVWEHAYYLKYKNERNTYIDNWFNVIDWGNVSNRVRFVRRR